MFSSVRQRVRGFGRDDVLRFGRSGPRDVHRGGCRPGLRRLRASRKRLRRRLHRLARLRLVVPARLQRWVRSRRDVEVLRRRARGCDVRRADVRSGHDGVRRRVFPQLARFRIRVPGRVHDFRQHPEVHADDVRDPQSRDGAGRAGESGARNRQGRESARGYDDDDPVRAQDWRLVFLSGCPRGHGAAPASLRGRERRLAQTRQAPDAGELALHDAGGSIRSRRGRHVGHLRRHRAGVRHRRRAGDGSRGPGRSLRGVHAPVHRRAPRVLDEDQGRERGGGRRPRRADVQPARRRRGRPVRRRQRRVCGRRDVLRRPRLRDGRVLRAVSLRFRGRRPLGRHGVQRSRRVL